MRLFKREIENKQTNFYGKPERNYDKLLRASIFLISLVAITPLIILTVINYFQYRKAYEADIIYPLTRQTNNLKNNLESFIQERISVLKYIAQSYTSEELSNPKILFQIYHSLRNSFGGFVDIGIIDENGLQINYVGPYQLLGKNYKSQKWFNNVVFKGVDVSEVFMGFRGFPHFTISVFKTYNTNNPLIIRASINTEILKEKIESQEIHSHTDVFIVSQSGLLQKKMGLINLYGFIHDWKAQKYDGFIGLITFITTLYFAPHIDYGILIGAILSLALYIQRGMRPEIAFLSKHPDTTFRNRARFGLAQCKHIAVIRYNGSLVFKNVNYLENTILRTIGNMPELKYIVIVGNAINEFDASGDYMLGNLIDRIREAGYDLFFTGLNDSVLDTMKRTLLYYKIGVDHFFRNVAMAVEALWDSAHRFSNEDPCPLKEVVYEKNNLK